MKLEQQLEKILHRAEDRFRDAVIDVHDAMTTRIFVKNIDIFGNKPDPYSTKPLWISREDLPREAGEPRGKKSRHFEGGYSQLKSEIGRRPIELKGELFKDFSTGLRDVGDNTYRVVINEKNQNKVDGHFDRFFKLSDAEKKYIIEALND